MKLRHYLAILLALAVLGVVGGGVFLRDSGGFAPMTVSALGDGTVEIHRGNEVILVSESGESVEPQDVIVTGPDVAGAKLNLETGRTITLARKSRLRIRSTTVVEAQQGALVADATQPMQVLFDDVTARFSSALFRLDRGFGSARAASYRGRVRLESAGEPRIELDRLKQVDVAAGDLPQETVPYRLAVRDALDTRFIPEVVTLTEDLDLLATGFARQVGTTRPGIDYFSDLADGNVSFMRAYLSRPAEDLLVAFTIADNDPDLSFKGSFNEAFDLFDDGASYGVAATILGARTQPLVAQLEQLIVGTGAVAADGGAGTATFGSDDGAGGSAIATGDETTTDADQTVSGGVEGETHEDVDDCDNVVDCGIQDVQDEIPPGPNTQPEEEEDPPDEGVAPSGGGSGGGGGGASESDGSLLDGVLDSVPKVPSVTGSLS